jgi:ADP-ribosylation factor GTPase-activating protein 1
MSPLSLDSGVVGQLQAPTEMCRLSDVARPAPDFFSAQLEEDPANRVCCDGGSGCAEWASVSHGIYLSIGAAGVHRSMGVRQSFVQSPFMDAWKPLHLRMMELGGNSRFNNFLREHNIPEDMPIREKYGTRAAAWYRRNLRAEAEGTELPEPLPEGTGHLPERDALPSDAILNKVFAEAKETDDRRSMKPCKSMPAIGVRRPSSKLLRKHSKELAFDVYESPTAKKSSMGSLVCHGLTFAFRFAARGAGGGAKYDSDGSDSDRLDDVSHAALPSLLVHRTSEAESPVGACTCKSTKSTKAVTFAS